MLLTKPRFALNRYSTSRLKPRLQFLVLFLFLSGNFPAASQSTWQRKVDPSLLAGPPGSQTEFIVYLARQADLSGAARLEARAEKSRYVYEGLSEIANRTQPAILAELSRFGVEVRPYWIANMVWVRGDGQALQAVAQRFDVAHVYANPQIHMERPIQSPTPETAQPLAAAGVEWNLQKVNAPQAWAAGIRGQGVVIGGADTGYQWTHPALRGKYRGWNGTVADHNYNWHDAIHNQGGGACGPDSLEPCDDLGHGTHTMGIMVGDDGQGNPIGMAPGSRWIGCRNMDAGVGSPATYAECYQWFMAPTDLNGLNPRPDLAPDIVNNSWGCPQSEGCTEPDVLRQAVENLRAAGILTVHSAGNEGSTCSSVHTPAAIYAASFTVGATNYDDSIAFFSSRGPVLSDGSGRLKPDISAPGTGIRSSVPAALYLGQEYFFMSGTSMAGPHVAGLAALLVSANPTLSGQVDGLEALIEGSAIPLTSNESCGGTAGAVPNNVYGWGRIDAWRALQQTHRLTVTKTASAAQIYPGGVLTYTLTLNHTHPTEPVNNVRLIDQLPVSSIFITATLPHSFDGAAVRWDFPSLEVGGSRSVQLSVQVPLEATGTVENIHYQATSDQAVSPVGPAVVTIIKLPWDFTLTPGGTRAVPPENSVTFTHTLTNTGSLADTYDPALSSSQGWASLAPVSPITLGPGESTLLTITVSVPANASGGSVETTQLTVTSRGNPSVSASATDITLASYRFFFPLIFK